MEIEERCLDFHQKYHDALAAEIVRIKAMHGFVILYDCHSTRSHIPHLFDGKLPDFNIGTFEGKSCSDIVYHTVNNQCALAMDYTHVLNGRFKGGWTTRNYGDPENDVHAIQMELAQSTYMDEDETWTYLHKVADQIRPVLRALLKTLSELDVS